MDPVQRELFGGWPRRVGTPSQHWVFNEGQFDLFFEQVDGNRNVYSTVSRIDLAEGPVCDKVLFDLDGDKSPFPDEMPDDQRIDRMRRDPDLAEAVLGKVCEEAQRLGRASRDDGIPLVGVFSGFGIHVHQLYTPTEEPKVAMTTCSAKYIEECDLDTADWQVVGDPQRICRVPNAERTTVNMGEFQEVSDGRGTGLYTVPLSSEELLDVTPSFLLEVSQSPRTPQPLYERDRTDMPIWEEYRDGVTKDVDMPARPLDQRSTPLDDEALEALLWDLIQMPCMVERMLQPNPEHKVRLNAAVLLFNVGLNPQQVEDLYAQLGWVDFDRQKTRSHLKSIYKSGYADMSCQTLREERLCTRTEEPSECSCYGWSNGQPEWL